MQVFAKTITNYAFFTSPIHFTFDAHPHRFSVSFSYYGLSLGADSLSDNLYVSCALMGLVELPGLLVCILTVDRLV